MITNFILLIVIQWLAPFPVFSASEMTNKKISHLQIGFYDLLSKKKEIYDVKIVINQNTLLSTIVDPNDNRFIFKGKFVQKSLPGQPLQYHYTPIFYHNPTSGLMVDGLIDYFTQHNMPPFTPIWVNGKLIDLFPNRSE
ncbi:hypothetical protein [Candidatus Regiella insecticola]|uniref:hypothetical protein n=1 Tax=Candidatus Regiella insecticola TaxID=138073 RepID=UPI0002D32069